MTRRPARRAALLAAAALTLCLAAGGARAQQSLTSAEVGRIIAAAANEANARGRPAHISVVDRVGNVLGVFSMTGAPSRVEVTSRRGIARTNGLEQVQDTFNALGAAASPSGRLSSITKAVTGAYLSSGGNAFTTRTASQIVQEHFNPGESFAPSGPLFGVQFSQLPCSDLSVRFATNATVTGLVSSTLGPKRSPLGLSADPGGMPLYKAGQVVGGIGIESDGLYTLDLSVSNFDEDPDELIALAGQALFTPPTNIRGNRIFLEGKTFRYTDAEVSQLRSNPGNASFAAVNGTLGSLTSVQGYYTAAAAPLAGQAYGSIASGFSSDNAGTYDFVGKPVVVLYNGGGTNRYPPTASTTPTVGGGGLTANEVTTIIGNALKIAFAGRAQIRQPFRSHIQVTVSVVDANGNILGVARTPDAPIFGTDVSLQKARTAAFFSSTGAGAYLQTYSSTVGSTPAAQNANGVRLERYLDRVRAFVGPSALADGIAFADRSGGNLSRPFYPDGIDGAPNGPFSEPFATWSPFNTGLQLDAVLDNIALHVLYADGIGGSTDSDATCSFFTRSAGGGTLTRIANGFQIFPGSVPIYRNGTVIGGIGVSGDGIDQDDMVSFLGLHDAGQSLNTGVGNAPAGIRADTLSPQGARLRYVNCPFKPFLGSNAQNVCANK
jgi:uncharacterized protein GlcG (DUF336 family)